MTVALRQRTECSRARQKLDSNRSPSSYLIFSPINGVRNCVMKIDSETPPSMLRRFAARLTGAPGQRARLHSNRFAMSMKERPAYEEELRGALWHRKRTILTNSRPSIVVAHFDQSAAEATALLLRLVGFPAVHAPDFESLNLVLEHWTPRVLLIDTRLMSSRNITSVQDLLNDPAYKRVLFLAMAGTTPGERGEELKRIGFDGFCRRPCEIWGITRIQNEHFRPR